MSKLKAFWATIHPKIKAVSITAVILAIISIGNQIVEVYPNSWWTPIVAAVILVLVGYQKAGTA